MKGCGGKIVTFIAGMLTGIILFVGSIAGVIYYALTAATIGQINDMTAKSDKISENEKLSAMSILDVISNMSAFLSDETATIGSFNDVFGIDLVQLLDDALGGLSDTAIYVRHSDVTGYDGADEIDQYIFDNQTLDFEISGSMGLGGSINIDTSSSPYRITVTKNDTAEARTTRYAVVSGAVAESASGGYVLVIEGAKTALANASFKSLTSDFSVLIDCLTLNSLFEMAGLNQSELPLLEKRSSLPVTMALNEIIDIFNDLDNLTIGDLQEELGITFEGQVFDTLQNTPIGQIGSEINNLTFAEIVPDLDRDLYVKVSDVSGSLPETVQSYYNSVVNISELTEARTLTRGTDIVYAGGVLTFNYGSDTWTAVDTSVTYGVHEDRLAERDGGEYYKAYIGRSSEVLKALADSTLNTMDADVDGLLLGDVLKIDENSPALLLTLKNTPINQLGGAIDTLALSEIIDIYEEDVYSLADGTEPGGTEYFQNDGDDENPVWTPWVSGDRYYVSQAQSSRILISLKDSNINNLSENIDALVLAEVIDIDVDEYRQVGSVIGITEYFVRTGVEGSYEFEPYDESVHGVIAPSQRWYLYHKGTSHIVLKKLAGVTVGDLGTEMGNVVDNIELGELIELTEDVYIPHPYTYYDDPSRPAVRFYKLLPTGEYVRWVYDPDYANHETMYELAAVGSSKVLLELKNVKVGNLGSEMQGVIDGLMLKEVLNIDGDLFREANPAEIAAGTNIFVKQSESGEAGNHDVYIVYEPANPYHTAASTPKYFRYYEGTSQGVIKKLAYVRIADMENTMPYAIDNTTIDELGISIAPTGIMNQPAIRNSRIKDLDDALNQTISNATIGQLVEWGNLSIDPAVAALLSDVTAQDFFAGLVLVTPDPMDHTTWYIAFEL